MLQLHEDSADFIFHQDGASPHFHCECDGTSPRGMGRGTEEDKM
jgi:hypothetical protein